MKKMRKISLTKRREVQSHGFIWEKELLENVYRATPQELANVKYTNKTDLPAKYNHIENCDISVKTSCNKNSVCMADCLRIFDAVNSDKPIHMVVIHYTQHNDSKYKKVESITEIDLSLSSELLFGNLSRSQLEELDKVVKSVPQKRKPTNEEYKKMYDIRNTLQMTCGALRLDIKCNSTQSRLQCSFNRFQQFIEKNPTRIIAASNTNEFRGGMISAEIISSKRKFMHRSLK
jgi:hypothetical protein